MNLTLTIIQGKHHPWGMGELRAGKGGGICTIFCFATARVAMKGILGLAFIKMPSTFA